MAPNTLRRSQSPLKLAALWLLTTVASVNGYYYTTKFSNTAIYCTSNVLILSRLDISCADGADFCSYDDDITISARVQINRGDEPLPPDLPTLAPTAQDKSTFPPSRDPDGLDEDEAEAQEEYYEQLAEQAEEAAEQAEERAQEDYEKAQQEYEEAYEQWEQDLEAWQQVTGQTELVLMNSGSAVYTDEVYLCNYLQPIYGDSESEGYGDTFVCPERGVYATGDFTFTIPSYDMLSTNMRMTNRYGSTSSNYMVALSLNLVNEAASTCTTVITMKQEWTGSRGSSSWTGASAGGAAAIVGLAGYLIRRRRRVAQIKLAEEEGSTSHFEMMPSSGNVM